MSDYVPAVLCRRLRGSSIRDCVCKLDDGWLECPPEARGELEPAPISTSPVPPLPGGVLIAEKPMTAVQEARAKGYTGDFCDLCGSTHVIRAGTCLRCDDCGDSSGGCG